MSIFQGLPNGAELITQIVSQCCFHLLKMAMGHEKYTAFRVKFGLNEYMVMPFGLTIPPPTFRREINRILKPVLGIELVINTTVDINEDNKLVVVAYIEYIPIATKESLSKDRRKVGKVFDLLLENIICFEINKCLFEQKSVTI